MSQNRVKLLFLASFAGMMAVYFSVLGEYKSVSLILDEYLFIMIALGLFIVSFFYKRKLRGIEVVDFNAGSNLTLRNTILLFLAFQVMDFIYEEGFLGMISQWFIYWIMGVIMVIVLDIINSYKNLKLQKLRGKF